jgi:hypothetical protein
LATGRNYKIIEMPAGSRLIIYSRQMSRKRLLFSDDQISAAQNRGNTTLDISSTYSPYVLLDTNS